ncbi:Protein FAM192A [Fukomys damarensis]|uniref:Protein FAM192A n=1 Tax=Fukomys damarensis TaxID=885580 RepID=A0A091DWL3_FUKDA|nr:Protein FAM192A [Fukomys damarensis]
MKKKLPVKPTETKNKFSQAQRLPGSVKHHNSEGGNCVKRLKPDSGPGLGVYSGSSDSESSSDSEVTVNATGKILSVSSIFRTSTFLEGP